jgi:hypothetical protein
VSPIVKRAPPPTNSTRNPAAKMAVGFIAS